MKLVDSLNVASYRMLDDNFQVKGVVACKGSVVNYEAFETVNAPVSVMPQERHTTLGILTGMFCFTCEILTREAQTLTYPGDCRG